MKAYLLVFDPVQVDKNVFRDTIDKLASVVNWTLFFGNTICLVSRKDALSLSREIQKSLPEAQFLISAIDPSQKAGWLPKQLWQFMNDPVPFTERSDA